MERLRDEGRSDCRDYRNSSKEAEVKIVYHQSRGSLSSGNIIRA
jgi:hypothetical protein